MREVKKEIKELWLTEAIKKFDKRFYKGYLNIINAPAGSGKTEFIFNNFIKDCSRYCNILNLQKKDILYICDTSMLKENMYENNKNKCVIAKTFDDLKYNKNIKIITYAKLGCLLKTQEGKNIVLSHKCIVLDEVHNLIKYSIRFDTEKETTYKNVIELLPQLSQQILTIGLSATEDILYSINRKIDELKLNILFNYKERSQIKRYKNYLVKCSNNGMNSIKKLMTIKKYIDKHNDKILIYTNTINQSKKYKKYLTEIGYNTEFLCSINNVNTIEIIDETTGKTKVEKIPKMTKKQLSLRDQLITTNKLPDELDILIINGAYETGWSLKDERVQFVIIDSSDTDIQIQARNRIRGDIKYLELIKQCTSSGEVMEYNQFRELRPIEEFISITILATNIEDKYIGVKLTNEDKKYLVYKYAMQWYDCNRTNWKTFKKDLDLAGYIVKTYKNDGTYIFEKDHEIKKDNVKVVKKMKNKECLINWIENDWDKKRITCQDVMDILDIGRKSFNTLTTDKEILEYFKTNRYKIGTIKNSKTKYLFKY